MVSKGLLENISAMVIFGTISIFVKNIAVSTGEIAFWRVLIALTVLLVYKLLKREKLPFKAIKGDIFPLILSGIAIGGDWILFFEAFKYTSVSVTTLSYYFCPVLVMVLSPILFKERLSIRQCLYFVMATIGLVLIIGARPGENSRELIGIGLGLAAAACYAFIILINKRIKSVSGIDKTVFQFFAAIIVLSIYVPMTSGFHLSRLDSKGLICLLILGVIHTGFAYCLYFTSVPKLTGQKVAILGYIDPVVAVIVSVFYFNEQITPIQLAGGIMIIAFTILNELSELSKTKAKAEALE